MAFGRPKDKGYTSVSQIMHANNDPMRHNNAARDTLKFVLVRSCPLQWPPVRLSNADKTSKRVSKSRQAF